MKRRDKLKKNNPIFKWKPSLESNDINPDKRRPQVTQQDNHLLGSNKLPNQGTFLPISRVAATEYICEPEIVEQLLV